MRLRTLRFKEFIEYKNNLNPLGLSGDLYVIKKMLALTLESISLLNNQLDKMDEETKNIILIENMAK